MSNEKWVMHILGPDDVIEYPDEISALRAANLLNKNMAGEMSRQYPNDPFILAVAKNKNIEDV